MYRSLKSVVRDALATAPVLRRVLRRVYREMRARTTGYSDVKELARLISAAAVSPGNRERPKVILATSMGGELTAVRMEALLAAALARRGAEPHFLLCDEVLPACQNCTLDMFPSAHRMVRFGPQRSMCSSCYGPAREALERLGFAVHGYGDYLTDEDREWAWDLTRSVDQEEMRTLVVDGIPVGEHAHAGALRFFARGELESEPEGRGVLLRYFQASLLATRAVQKMTRALRPRATVMHHGIYVPQGLVSAVTKSEGARVVVWLTAYRKNRFIFSHGDTYHHTLISEPTALWDSLELEGPLEQELMGYLHSRTSGVNDWIAFQSPTPNVDDQAIVAELGLDPKRPTIGMLTNVVWDAQLHYPANAFRDMIEWIKETVSYFASRPDIQLVIRVHPAEVKGAIQSRQRVVSVLESHCSPLPDNVFVIPPESPISTYRVAAMCDSVLIYGTKTGVELCAVGIPVIVAGEAWIKNKGLTRDAASRDEYFDILRSLPIGERLSDDIQARARRYAYHFFYRRMIPVTSVSQTGGWPPFAVTLHSVEALDPGPHDPGLDVICNGILDGDEFVYPAERL